MPRDFISRGFFISSCDIITNMKDMEREIQEYLEERGWTNASPADYAKSISIEAGELLEHFQWGNLSKKELFGKPEKLAEIKKELADIFIYAFDMAILLDLDTQTIIKEKLEHNRKKFPPEKVKGNSDYYYKIKKEYRKKGV